MKSNIFIIQQYVTFPLIFAAVIFVDFIAIFAQRNYPPRIIHHPKNRVVLENEHITFNCKADGHPESKIVWFKDEKQISFSSFVNTPNHFVISNGSLQLKHVKPDAEGLYYCIASNGFGQAKSIPAKLTVIRGNLKNWNSNNVNEPPTNHFSTALPSNEEVQSRSPIVVTFNEGDKATLQCQGKFDLGNIYHEIHSQDGVSSNGGSRESQSAKSYNSTSYLMTATNHRSFYGLIWKIFQTDDDRSHLDANAFDYYEKEGKILEISRDLFNDPSFSISRLHRNAFTSSSSRGNNYNGKAALSAPVVSAETSDNNLATKDTTEEEKDAKRYTMTRDGELIIENVRHEDEGIYSCFLIPDQYPRPPNRLHTPYHPPSPSLLRHHKHHHKQQQQQQSKRANDKYVTREHHQPMELEHSSKTKSTFLTQGNLINLVVFVKPTFIKTPLDVTAITGDDIEFECIVEGKPDPTVIWKRKGGDRAIPERSLMTELKSLRILRVEQADEGDYACEARNHIGSIQMSASLTVHSRPAFVVAPRDRSVDLNGVANFDCVTTGNPLPSVYWTREGSQVLMFPDRPHGRFSVSADGELKITGVQREDQGYYVCSALSVAGSSIAKAFLEVIGGPNGGRQEDSNAVNDIKTRSSDLNTRPESNNAKNNGKTFREENQIFYPPIISRGPSNQTVAENGHAFLPCTLANPEPGSSVLSNLMGTKISWFKGEDLLDLNEPRFQTLKDGSLQIRNLRQSDTGIYTCLATSTFKSPSSLVVSRVHDGKILPLSIDPLKKAGGEYLSTSWSAALTVRSPRESGIKFSRVPDSVSLPGPPSKPYLLTSPKYSPDNQQRNNESATDITKYSITMAWQPVSQNEYGSSKVLGYMIEYFSPSAPDLGWIVSARRVDSTSYRVSGLKPDTPYIFLVRAENLYGLGLPSPVSDVIYTFPTDHTENDITAPSSLYDLAEVQEKLGASDIIEFKDAKPISSTSIRLQWKVRKNQNYIQGFYLKYRPDPSLMAAKFAGLTKLLARFTNDEGDDEDFFKNKSYSTSPLPALSKIPFQTVTLMDNSISIYTVKGLQKFTLYQFMISPFFDAVEGANSNIIYARTMEDVPSWPPLNLMGQIRGDNNFVLSWDPPLLFHQNGIIRGYKIQRSYIPLHALRSSILAVQKQPPPIIDGKYSNEDIAIVPVLKKVAKMLFATPNRPVGGVIKGNLLGEKVDDIIITQLLVVNSSTRSVAVNYLEPGIYHFRVSSFTDIGAGVFTERAIDLASLPPTGIGGEHDSKDKESTVITSAEMGENVKFILLTTLDEMLMPPPPSSILHDPENLTGRFDLMNAGLGIDELYHNNPEEVEGGARIINNHQLFINDDDGSAKRLEKSPTPLRRPHPSILKKPWIIAASVAALWICVLSLAFWSYRRLSRSYTNSKFSTVTKSGLPPGYHQARKFAYSASTTTNSTSPPGLKTFKKKKESLAGGQDLGGALKNKFKFKGFKRQQHSSSTKHDNNPCSPSSQFHLSLSCGGGGHSGPYDATLPINGRPNHLERYLLNNTVKLNNNIRDMLNKSEQLQHLTALEEAAALYYGTILSQAAKNGIEESTAPHMSNNKVPSSIRSSTSPNANQNVMLPANSVKIRKGNADVAAHDILWLQNNGSHIFDPNVLANYYALDFNSDLMSKVNTNSTSDDNTQTNYMTEKNNNNNNNYWARQVTGNENGISCTNNVLPPPSMEAINKAALLAASAVYRQQTLLNHNNNPTTNLVNRRSSLIDNAQLLATHQYQSLSSNGGGRFYQPPPIDYQQIQQNIYNANRQQRTLGSATASSGNFYQDILQGFEEGSFQLLGANGQGYLSGGGGPIYETPQQPGGRTSRQSSQQQLYNHYQALLMSSFPVTQNQTAHQLLMSSQHHDFTTTQEDNNGTDTHRPSDSTNRRHLTGRGLPLIQHQHTTTNNLMSVAPSHVGNSDLYLPPSFISTKNTSSLLNLTNHATTPDVKTLLETTRVPYVTNNDNTSNGQFNVVMKNHNYLETSPYDKSKFFKNVGQDYLATSCFINAIPAVQSFVNNTGNINNAIGDGGNPNSRDNLLFDLPNMGCSSLINNEETLHNTLFAAATAGIRYDVGKLERGGGEHFFESNGQPVSATNNTFDFDENCRILPPASAADRKSQSHILPDKTIPNVLNLPVATKGDCADAREDTSLEMMVGRTSNGTIGNDTALERTGHHPNYRGGGHYSSSSTDNSRHHHHHHQGSKGTGGGEKKKKKTTDKSGSGVNNTASRKSKKVNPQLLPYNNGTAANNILNICDVIPPPPPISSPFVISGPSNSFMNSNEHQQNQNRTQMMKCKETKISSHISQDV